jgi:NADPH2:quinone reductase
MSQNMPSSRLSANMPPGFAFTRCDDMISSSDTEPLPETMLAAWYTQTGPASEVFRLGHTQTPSAGPGELLVRLRASGVNPSDWKMRDGVRARPMLHPLVIPHSDGAGVVVATGDGVDISRIGQRVWIWNGQWGRPYGTAAQYIALPAEQAMPLPEPLAFEEGACLGIPACTAMQAVRLAELAAGSTVLVQGGAGSVGHYAIQFAKRQGAVVFTTVSSAAKAAHARAAGADHVLDYKTEDVAKEIRQATGGRGVDAIIEVDLAANADKYSEYLRSRGNVVVYGMGRQRAELPAFSFMAQQLTLRFVFIYDISAEDRAAGLHELQTVLKAGALKHSLGAVMPLADIARAHETVQRGEVIGNVVLRIP